MPDGWDQDWGWTQRPAAPGPTPVYARAALADLHNEPLTPLSRSVGAASVLGPAWRELLAASGVPQPRSPVAAFGGHLFLDLTGLRRLAQLLPDLGARAFDQLFLTAVQLPDLGDADDTGTDADRAQARAWWDATMTGGPGGRVAPSGRTEQHRGEVADESDAGLVERLLADRDGLAGPVGRLVTAEQVLAAGWAVVSAMGVEIGIPDVAASVLVDDGDFSTKGVEQEMWDLSRALAWSPDLRPLSERTTDGVSRRVTLGHAPALRGLRDDVDAFVARNSHRGSAEWELGDPTWGADREAVFQILAFLQHSADDRSPERRRRTGAARVAAVARELESVLGGDPNTLALYRAVGRAIRAALTARTASMDAIARIHREQRATARELARRAIRAGALDDPEQLFLLRGHELDAFAADPAAFTEQLRMRRYDHQALLGYRPPGYALGLPPELVRWERAMDASHLRVGDTLPGVPASPGRVSGAAVVLPSPARVGPLRPGSVLVVRSAGGAWIPLLSGVAAVVVDAGWMLSPTAIASRELDVPCIVATGEASSRIQDGATVDVDATAGVVTVLGSGG